MLLYVAAASSTKLVPATVKIPTVQAFFLQDAYCTLPTAVAAFPVSMQEVAIRAAPDQKWFALGLGDDAVAYQGRADL